MNPENQIPPAQTPTSKLNTKLIIIVVAVLFVGVLSVVGFLVFKSYFGKPVTTKGTEVVNPSVSPDRGVAPSNLPSAIPIPIKL